MNENHSGNKFKQESFDISLIQDWRSHYVDLLVAVFAFIGAIGLLASITRFITVGWLNIFFVHIMGSVLLISVYILRKRLTTNLKCLAIIAASFIGGLAGTLSFGLAGTGIIYVIHAAIFSAIFVNKKLALTIIVFLACFIAGVGFLFSNGYLQPEVDLNKYVSSYSSWLATLCGPIFISVVFIFVISKVRAKLIKTLLQLEGAKSELKQAALHDSLTGLPNTRYINEIFEEHVKNMRRNEDPIAVLLIDLDNFKQVNDRYGHMEGDKLLIEVAKRMKASIRETDIAARLGGDEFLVFLRNIKHKSDIENIARNLVININSAFDIIPGETIHQGLSVGASLIENPSGISLESYLKDADAAMYKLKALGKNGFFLNEQCFFMLEKEA